MAYDFDASRDIVNGGEGGTRRQQYIDACDRWLARLQSGEFEQMAIAQSGGMLGKGTASPTTAPPTPTTGNPNLDLVDESDRNTSFPDKGQETIITMGDGSSASTSFHFIHTGTAASIRPNQLTLKGHAIRWLLSRRTLNTTYQDITLRELAELVCEAHGLRLEMDGDGPTYAQLDQTGLSDFGLLHRECRAVGFLISETENTLKIAPMRPGFTGYVVRPGEAIAGSLRFSDSASADMPVNRGTGSAGEPKAEIDAATGSMGQVRPENKGGVATAPGQNRTGATGTGSAPVYGTIAVSDTEAGLPTQKTGAIALSDGTQIEAQQLSNEVQRVQGYPGSIGLKMTPATLTLIPGSIIALSPEVAGGVFAREWRISQVTHSIGGGSVSRTDVQFYSPQKALPKKSPSQNSTPGADSSLTSNASVSGYVPPHKSGTTWIGDGIGWRSSSRRHKGFDFAGDYGTPTLAMKGGSVVIAVSGCREGDGSCGGGFGNFIVIDHGDGLESIYAHLDQLYVAEGDVIETGQAIASMGSTGRSSGPHSHIQLQNAGGGGEKPLSSVGIDVHSFSQGQKRESFEY